MSFLDERGLQYFANWVNKRINDVVTKGLHNCSSCGAPYMGKPVCEYCGRGFFVDFAMYKEEKRNDSDNR